MIAVLLNFLVLYASLKKSVGAGLGRLEYPAGPTQYRHGTPSASMRSEPSVAAPHELGIVQKASACITGDLMKCALCTCSHDCSARLLSRAILNCLKREEHANHSQGSRDFTQFLQAGHQLIRQVVGIMQEEGLLVVWGVLDQLDRLS